MNPRPILLVHGAWHGAWCWSALQAELDRRGVPSHAIDLPGHGSSLASFGGLYDDALHVRETLDRLGRDGVYGDEGFILVGHSYGGAVITQAALKKGGELTREDIAHLVYVAAFALDPGESVMAALGSFAREEAPSDPKPNILAQAIQQHADGNSTINPEFAAEAFYGACPPAETAAAIQRLCPQPGATMIEAPEGAPREAIPSTYVRCLRDQAISPAQQSLMANRCTDSFDLDTDHSPFISQTVAIAEILERVATRS